MKKIYSPSQISTSTFLLGGPISATYFLRKNFIEMENHKAAKGSLIYGFLLTIALWILVFYLPQDFPKLLIPAAGAGVSWFLASKYNLRAIDIIKSDTYDFQPIWRVFIVTIISCVLFITLGILVRFFLINAGLLILEG